jgi:hypothetical protein
MQFGNSSADLHQINFAGSSESFVSAQATFGSSSFGGGCSLDGRTDPLKADTQRTV